MSETIEFDLNVSKVNRAEGEDLVLTVTLVGGKAVLLSSDAPGFELIDMLEVKLTIKCAIPQTLKQLGIEEYMNHKVVVLRDRDESLESFGEMEPADVKQRTGVLAAYEGIVPEDALKKIETTVPDELLQSLE